MRTQQNIIKMLLMVISYTAAAAAGQQNLKVGDKAPEFKAMSDDGTVWNMNKFIGKDYIVVYFFPAAMTGGCTKEACAYRDLHMELHEAGVEVVGVSGDNVDGLKLFKHAENLNFPLLSDPEGKIAELYGVPVSEGGSIVRTVDGSEHKLLRGVTEKRWTFIIGKDRKIIYKNDSVNPEKDSGEVLAFIKNQKSK